MYVRGSGAATRKMDDVEIKNLITRQHCDHVSLAEADIDGVHGPSRSRWSHRVYYVVSGAAVVTIDDDSFEVGPGDAVLIPQGAVHGMSGTAKYLVINAPAFDPDQEEELSRE